MGIGIIRVHLGTAVSQLSARPPVTLAMTAMTMDHLTQGRVLLGIGTSNPQVVEGWYGQPYPRPLERTREYIDIVRQVIARQQPASTRRREQRLRDRVPLSGLRSNTGSTTTWHAGQATTSTSLPEVDAASVQGDPDDRSTSNPNLRTSS